MLTSAFHLALAVGALGPLGATAPATDTERTLVFLGGGSIALDSVLRRKS